MATARATSAGFVCSRGQGAALGLGCGAGNALFACLSCRFFCAGEGGAAATTPPPSPHAFDARLLHDDCHQHQGWFDDRVECRNALSKLGYLYAIRDLDRREIPWSRYPEERQDYPLRTGYVPASFLRKAKAAKEGGEPSTLGANNRPNDPLAVDRTTARRAARTEEAQREREQQQQEAAQEQQQAGAGL